MKKLEKEYNVIKTKEQEEMSELKVRIASNFYLPIFLYYVKFISIHFK